MFTAEIDFDAWRQRIKRETLSAYHYEMGVAIEREGNLPASIAAYTRAIEINPFYPEAYYRLIEALRAQGETALLDDVRAQAISYDPDFEKNAEKIISYHLLLNRKYQDALSYIERAYERGQGDYDLNWIYACCLYLNERVPEAIHVASDMPPPEADIALELGQRISEKAFDIFVLARDQNDEIKKQEAISGFSFYVQLSANWNAPYFFLGEERWNSGKRDEACRLWKMALIIDPAHYDTYSALSSAFVGDHRYDDAEEMLVRMSIMRPNDFNIFVRGGDVSMVKLEFAHAANQYRIAYDKLPKSSRSGQDGIAYFLNLGVGMASLGLGAYEEARSAFQTSFAFDPEGLAAFNQYGSVLQAQGNHADAVRLFERGSACVPDSAWALGKLGLSRLALGDLDGAERALFRALSCSGLGWIEAASNRALLLHAQGDFAEAFAQHRQAIDAAELDPDVWVRAWARGNHAITLMATGQRDAARQALGKATDAAAPWLRFQQDIRPDWARRLLQDVGRGALQEP